MSSIISSLKLIFSDNSLKNIDNLRGNFSDEEVQILQELSLVFRELKLSKSRMDSVFENSPQPILVLNPEMKITDVNPSFLKTSGYITTSCIDHHITDIIPGFKDDMDAGEKDSETFRIQFPSGDRVLEQFQVPVRNDDSSLREILLIFKDITKRVAAEQEAERTREQLLHDYGERVKEQRLFYSVASHIQDDAKTVSEVLHDIVHLIPPGWQYPEVTAARIRYCNETHTTINYKETNWIQRALFRTKNGNEGIIEVVYLEEKPTLHEGPFLLEERNLINSLAEMLKTYIERKEGEQILALKMHDLGERVKEQQLFYSTASLIQDDSLQIGEVLQKVVTLIPPGWQYPDDTVARITYNDELFTTPVFKETDWVQQSNFRTRNGSQGRIEVLYLTRKPNLYEGPFLLEERNLINSLAEMLKTYIERKEGEQILEQKMHDLGERVKEQQLFYSTASLIQDDSLQITDVMSRVTSLIPPGWQYPEITAARIQYGDLSYQTPNFRETPWVQRSSFITKNGTKGNIEVVYLSEMPTLFEGPFLLEERNLINSLAEMLKTYSDRKEGELELARRITEIEELEHLNNSIVQQIPMPVLLIDEEQKIIVTNDAYIQLTGYTRDELLQMTPRDITVVDYSGEGLRELLQTIRPTFGELTCKFPSGVRNLEQYGIPIFNKSGSLEHFLIVYNDITERKEREKEVSALLEESRKNAEVLTCSAADLEKGISGLAKGDLRFRAPITDNDPLLQIKKDYNLALDEISLLISELEGSITHLKERSEETIVETESINASITNVAEEVQESTTGARRQMEETRKITAEIHSLSGIIDQIVEITANLMEHALQAVRQGEEAGAIGKVANQKMESVGKISADSMVRITGLNEQMTEIDKIVRLIADISSQTNLLALNAAIEAARAGEHGRGFAVVAQEVKNLAGQSKLATGQIEELIRTIQSKSSDTVQSIEAAYHEITEGISSVNQTIEALSAITSRVNTISDGMNRISDSTRSEEQLMTRVQEGIEIMNTESEQNLSRMEGISALMTTASNSTTDIAKSSHEIAELSIRLKDQSDRFNL